MLWGKALKWGMNLVDFESKVKTLKVSFIKRLLNDSPGKWKNMANHFYNARDLESYLKCNRNENLRIEHNFIMMFTTIGLNYSESKK